jgi:hypothetical protein
VARLSRFPLCFGTAVDGTDFNVPATGEVIIPAGQFNQDLAVPLVNEGMFDATKSFTIAITGTTSPITITQSTAGSSKDEGIIDLGGVRTARGPENYIVLFFETIGVPKSPFFNIHITR